MPTASLNRRRCWSSATKDSFDCKVVFPVARHDLQEQFAGNAQELDRLKEFLSENLNIQGTELKGGEYKRLCLS